MERLVEWNCKEKNSALPIAVNDFGDVASTEDICAQLATLYDIIGDYDLDRLRELIRADREGRCFVLLVAPDPYAGEGEEQVVVCEDGEATPCNVIEATIGPDGNGEMNIVYDTEGPTFQTADIGKTVFLPHETDKIEAALAKMREEGCEK